jgi:hypothetical protein
MPFALQIHFQMRPGSKLSEVVREATASRSERLCAAGKKDERDREDRVGEETISGPMRRVRKRHRWRQKDILREEMTAA